ncbi:MAG TPA: hypothetical protein VKY85_09110 [Candidatus Angelobacter sp.]|nr:hypothetical protein [Candidatus Angelobacter sp.]
MSNKGTTLSTGESLNVNDFLLSDNGQYKAIMQTDGNFVIYKANAPVWASNTVRGNGTYFAVMQTDGNLVLYLGTPQHQGAPYWASNTVQGPGTYLLTLQNDGSLALYRGASIWSTNGHPKQTGTQPAFPIQASQHDSFPGSGGLMDTTVTINKNGDGSGHLNAVTHIWEITQLRGFRGSVAVVLLDENKNSLWVSHTETYGVDGKMLGTSDRTENWSDTVPAPLLTSVRFLAIIQKWNPKDAFDDINRWLQGVGNVANEVASIVKAVATIVAAL